MKKVLTGLALFAPALVFAQDFSELENLGGLTGALSSLIETLIPLIFGIALLFFLWGLAKYIFAAGNEEAKEGGKRIMIWGIIALFIMASVWGIVAFLQGVFGVADTGGVTLPSAPGDSGGGFLGGIFD